LYTGYGFRPAFAAGSVAAFTNLSQNYAVIPGAYGCGLPSFQLAGEPLIMLKQTGHSGAGASAIIDGIKVMHWRPTRIFLQTAVYFGCLYYVCISGIAVDGVYYLFSKHEYLSLSIGYSKSAIILFTLWLVTAVMCTVISKLLLTTTRDAIS
jgi:hypothetical protein